LITDGIYEISGFSSEDIANRTGKQITSGVLPLSLTAGSTYTTTAYQGSDLLTTISTAVLSLFL
jgi:hypothetical protein